MASCSMWFKLFGMIRQNGILIFEFWIFSGVL